MKVEINGKIFEVSFELNSNITYFTLKLGDVMASYKLGYISNWLVLQSITKKFRLTKHDIEKLRNEGLWKIISQYETWRKMLKNAKT